MRSAQPAAMTPAVAIHGRALDAPFVDDDSVGERDHRAQLISENFRQSRRFGGDGNERGRRFVAASSTPPTIVTRRSARAVGSAVRTDARDG